VSGTILAERASGDRDRRSTLTRRAQAPISLASQKDIDRGLCLPPALSEETLPEGKDVRLLGPLFAHLHGAAPARDRAGNRPLFSDQSARVRLLSFFTPVVTSRRGLPQPPRLAQVPERLGGHPLGSGHRCVRQPLPGSFRARLWLGS
jgi:hypothetical protein